jgi:hypothetical protein
MDKLEAEERLKKYEDRLKQGQDNMKIMQEKKVQRVREQRGGVPDIQQLRKKEEDRSFGVWEKFIIKTSEVEKNKQKILKKEALVRKEKQDNNQMKMMQIRENINQNKRDMAERASEINEKFDKMDIKIDQANQRKMMYSVKHREIENLRFNDFKELR